MAIHFHRKPNGWYYFAIGEWAPFAFLQHGGWVCLNPCWFWRYLITVPRQRGWRWD